MAHQIIDNFLDQEDFKKLKETVLSNSFPWYFEPVVNELHSKKDKTSYFVHIVFNKTANSSYFNFFNDVFTNKLKVKSYIRIKANLYPKTKNLENHEPHVDYDFIHSGAIFYVNTNDGFTILEKGEKIESIENRLLLFEANKPHNSTNCTNSKYRININFTYF